MDLDRMHSLHRSMHNFPLPPTLSLILSLSLFLSLSLSYLCVSSCLFVLCLVCFLSSLHNTLPHSYSLSRFSSVVYLAAFFSWFPCLLSRFPQPPPHHQHHQHHPPSKKA